MENMYDILARLNSVDTRRALTEGRAVKEDDVEEGNRFTGELMKARAAGKKQADLDGDGKTEPVKEAKKAKPDFLDVDGDGNRKESFKKAVKDRARGKRPVKESLRVVRVVESHGAKGSITHDREYDEYQVCVTSDRGVQRAFVDDRDAANQLLENLMAERQAKSRGKSKDRPFFPRPDADDEKTAFRKKFAPSVMRDPKARGELEKLDLDLERLKKMRRGELDPDDMGDEPPAGEKRGRGRPKKYTADRPRQERVTAKARKADRTAWTPNRKKKKVAEQDYKEPRDEYGDPDDGSMYDPRPQKEREQDREKWDDRHHDDLRRGGMAEDYDQDEYDEEGEMAQSQSRTIADAARELESMLDANENLPEWVQKKITLAQEYIDSARDYLKSNRPKDSDEEMALPEGSTGDYSAKKARAGKDIGKPGKQFAKIAKSAGERYGSKERGEKVAGAVLAKLRAKESIDEADMDESALQAHIGKKKYGKEGMAALQRAGREGAGKDQMDRIRGQHDKLSEGNFRDVDDKTGEKIGQWLDYHIDGIFDDRPELGSALIKLMNQWDTGSMRFRDLKDAVLDMFDARDWQRADFIKKFAPNKVRVTQPELFDGEQVSEKAVSRAQRAAAGIARAAQKGEIPRSELRGASKEMAKMEPKELGKFAKTKEKGLPEKKKEESVEETTTAGSVATTPTGGEKKSKGGIQYGKGVYEARLAEQFAREMNTVMAEGLDVAITANADGTNTVTVTGKDVAPDVLQDLLQMAGMSGTREPVYQPVEPAMSGGGDMASMLDTLDELSAGGDDMAEPMAEETVCERCGGHRGMHEAGCDREMALEADLANSADRTETMSTDYMVDELAGGLNGPKRQVNPNNVADNPLAMPDLAKSAHSLNLGPGAMSEDIQRESEDRLLALYRSIK